MRLSVSHISNLKVLSHEEVEGGAGVGSDGANATATVPQEPQAQVSTLLCLLLKQQLWKLKHTLRLIHYATKHHTSKIKGTVFHVITKRNCIDQLELNQSIQTQ